MIRRYSEMVLLDSFIERFRYLNLEGAVGRETFGFDRWINQRFYVGREWKDTRDVVLIRDENRDLGIKGHEISDRPIIHHMNPMLVRDIVENDPRNYDPEFLITTTHQTHNAIHYGNEKQLPRPFVERRPGDTKLW